MALQKNLCVLDEMRSWTKNLNLTCESRRIYTVTTLFCNLKAQVKVLQAFYETLNDTRTLAGELFCSACCYGLKFKRAKTTFPCGKTTDE